MTLLDMPTKNFAPSYSLPWTSEPVSINAKIVSYIFVGLGFTCFIYSLFSYFKNQQQIVKRLLWVGHGWMGYTIAAIIIVFVIFIMVMALTEIQPPV
jgi:putative membrane protein